MQLSSSLSKLGAWSATAQMQLATVESAMLEQSEVLQHSLRQYDHILDIPATGLAAQHAACSCWLPGALHAEPPLALRSSTMSASTHADMSVSLMHSICNMVYWWIKGFPEDLGEQFRWLPPLTSPDTGCRIDAPRTDLG